MHWLIILALAAIAVWQGIRLGALARRVADLEKRVGALAGPPIAAAAPAPAPLPSSAVEPPAEADAPASPIEAEPAPLLLDQSVGDDELVLDTPLPEASNDAGPAPVAAAVAAPPPRAAIWSGLPRLGPTGRLAQALAATGVACAMIAPAAGAASWSSAVLTLALAAIGAAGLGLAALQRWSWVALATLIGLYAWFWHAIAVDDIRRALALLSFASFGAVSLALRAPLADAGRSFLPWSRLHALTPTLGVVVSSVFLIFVWAAVAPSVSGRVAGPALISVFHIALAAYAIRGRAAMAPALIVAIGALVGGCAAYLQARFYIGPLGADFYPVVLAAAFATVLCALSADPHRRWRTGTAAAGAIGAALLVALAAFTRPEWRDVWAWAALFGGALGLFAAAWSVGRDSTALRLERVRGFWACAGAALVLLGIESATPAEARAPVHAAAALLFATAIAWPGWRMLRYAMLAAGAMTLAHAVGPALIPPAVTGQIPVWGALVVLAVAAALLFGAGYFAKAEPRQHYSIALSAGGAIVVLLAAYLLLRSAGVREGAAIALVVLGAGLALVIFLQLAAPHAYSRAVAQVADGVQTFGARARDYVGVAGARIGRALAPSPKPTDLLNITPSPRRERRYGRRQRTQ